jgi:hypothetical protein
LAHPLPPAAVSDGPPSRAYTQPHIARKKFWQCAPGGVSVSARMIIGLTTAILFLLFGALAFVYLMKELR